jgi:uncharacterized membrane protein
MLKDTVGGISFIVASFVIGLLSVLFPFLGVLALMKALEQGQIALWLLFALPILGLIVAIVGFVVRKKGGDQLKGCNAGVKVLAFFMNYFGIAANVIGLLFNAGVLVALFVIKDKLGI